MASALMPVEEVLDRLLGEAVPVAEIERVALDSAVDRVLAENQASTIDVPPADNSAMDGYALNSGDDLREGQWLQVSQRIPAGVTGTPLEPGTAARIFTGAEIPPGADSVIMQEEVEVRDGQVALTRIPTTGENVRERGQDIRSGQCVVEAGARLTPAALGLLASIGIGEVPVRRRLRVALVTTGDELVMPGRPLGPGQIYNSNLFLLKALVQRLGMEVIEFAAIADDPDETRQALLEAARVSDCVVSSGGVSVGEEDHVKASVEALGRLSIWRINIKPGKPLAYGDIGGTPFFGLPGNPVSTFITFCLFARPFLLSLQGVADPLPRVQQVIAQFEHRAGGRQEYIRVRHCLTDEGRPAIEKFPQQGSGVLSSVHWASGLAVIRPGVDVGVGDLCEVLNLNEIS